MQRSFENKHEKWGDLICRVRRIVSLLCVSTAILRRLLGFLFFFLLTPGGGQKNDQVVRAGGFAEAEALVTAGVARKAADVLAKALYAKTVQGEGGKGFRFS